MKEYILKATQGERTFYASDDFDAVRKALFLCKVNKLDFWYVESADKSFTLIISKMIGNHFCMTL